MRPGEGRRELRQRESDTKVAGAGLLQVVALLVSPSSSSPSALIRQRGLQGPADLRLRPGMQRRDPPAQARRPSTVPGGQERREEQVRGEGVRQDVLQAQRLAVGPRGRGVAQQPGDGRGREPRPRVQGIQGAAGLCYQKGSGKVVAGAGRRRRGRRRGGGSSSSASRRGRGPRPRAEQRRWQPRRRPAGLLLLLLTFQRESERPAGQSRGGSGDTEKPSLRRRRRCRRRSQGAPRKSPRRRLRPRPSSRPSLLLAPLPQQHGQRKRQQQPSRRHRRSAGKRKSESESETGGWPGRRRAPLPRPRRASLRGGRRRPSRPQRRRRAASPAMLSVPLGRLLRDPL